MGYAVMTLGRLASLLLLASILGFIGIHLQGLISAPPLTVSSPRQGLTTSSKAVEIQGETLPGATIEINGSPLLSPQSGKFKHLLILNGGVNTITVTARKRYSRPAVIERQVFILDGGKISQGTGGGI